MVILEFFNRLRGGYTMSTKIFNLGYIVFIAICVLFFSTHIDAQQLIPEVGIEIIPYPEDLKSRSDFAVLSSNTLGDIYRYPAEEKYWLKMVNATAYFRDVLVGAITYISGATDVETWNIEILYPEGTSQILSPVVFYQSYDGYSNCFVYEGTILYCGSTNATVLWRVRVQCFSPGLWTINFYNNNNYLFLTQFTLLPQIYPEKVPLYNQGAYNNPNNTDHIYDNVCRTSTCTTIDCDESCGARENEVRVTIAQEGCYLTNAAMILNYHGVSIDPPTLNTWLINNNGYDENGRVYPDAIVDYANTRGITLTYPAPEPDSQKVWSGLEELEKYICYYGPHIIGVRPNQRGFPRHWVTATGKDANGTTYLINDPNGGVSTTLAQGYGSHVAERRFGGPEYTYTDRTGIIIRFHSPGELLLTDPQGRKVGYDPINGVTYNEIPGAYYEGEAMEDDITGEPGPESKELMVPRPLAGDYQLKVIGTDIGTYTLEIRSRDPELNLSKQVVRNISISTGTVHTYGFYYAKTVGAELEFKAIEGNFDGKGQRPSDVNKFLSYVTPTQSTTTLPVGATSFGFVIVYDKNIIPSTFTAELNGVDVRSLFKPVSGGAESVTLNLNQGRNTLILSVEGNLPNRVARDTDRLVFIVP
jgi:hypothetical protein